MAQYSSGDVVYTVSLDTKNMLEESKRVRDEFKAIESGSDNASSSLTQLDKTAHSTGKSLGNLSAIAKGVGLALMSNKIIAYAEAWNELEDRIQNTGLTAKETKDVLSALNETSNRNGRAIEESAELYIKLSNSMSELGYHTNDTLSYIDTLSNLMTINKTNTMASESAINA